MLAGQKTQAQFNLKRNRFRFTFVVHFPISHLTSLPLSAIINKRHNGRVVFSMGMVQTFFLGILLFFQSVFAPLIYDIPQGAVDYGGGAYGAAAVAAEGLALFEDGASDYVIVVPDGAPQSYLTGARWLNEFLNEMLGNEKTAPPVLPVLTESAYTAGKCVVLGRTALGGAAFNAAVDALETDEGFVKMAADGNIFICGKGTGRGTMYGCASFIEEQLGCRWFTPTLRSVPKKRDIFVPADLDDTQEALLDYRDDYAPYVADYPEFKAFHKLNSFMGQFPMGGEYGGSFNYIGGFCHTMYDLIPRSLFDTQPELFSYQKDKGAWSPEQRCLTNEAVFEMVRDRVFAYIQGHRGDMNYKIVSVTQEDNDYPCQCPKCLAMDELYGGPSGTNLWFTNRIADAIWEAFPDRRDILVDTFAYTYTLPPPTGIVPKQNVIVRLCSIGCCFCHTIEECGHGRGADGIFADMSGHESEFAKYIKEWDALCKVNGAQMYVWDYNTCFKFYPAIYPNLQVLAANLQFFVENSVRGVFEESYDLAGKNMLVGSCSGEFGELRGYMLAKLLWNPYLNSNQLLEEFMDAYYGADAAPYIREFLDYYTNKTMATNHLGVFGRPEAFTYLNIFECKKLEKLFDQAEAAATGDRLLHVKQTRLCLKLYEANMMLGDYSWFNPCRLANNKALFHECVMLGMDRFSAPMVMPYSDYVWLYRPYDWGSMKSWVEFVDKDKLVWMDLEAYRAENG